VVKCSRWTCVNFEDFERFCLGRASGVVGRGRKYISGNKYRAMECSEDVCIFVFSDSSADL